MMQLIDHYSSKYKLVEVRPMYLDEARMLRYGNHVEFCGLDGQLYRARVNGKPKVWKRRPKDVEISLKYGLKDHFHVLMIDSRWRACPFLVVRVKQDLTPQQCFFDESQPADPLVQERMLDILHASVMPR